MSADPLTELMSALVSEGRLAIVYTPDLVRREEVLEEVETLLDPSVRVWATGDASEALASPDDVVLLVPSDEPTALRLIEGCRTAVERRTQPIVVFLAERGTGQAWLAAEGAGIASFAQGSVVDATLDPSDPDELRAAFEAETGVPVDEWLAEYRAGRLPDTDENARRFVRALALEPQP